MLQRLLTIWGRVSDYVSLGLFASLVAVTILWRFSVADLALEKEGRARDLSSFTEAQSQAETKALKLKLEQEAKDRDKQKAADDRADDLRNEYSGLLRRYAEAQDRLRRANLSSVSSASEGSDGPGEDSFLPQTLVIPYADAEICAENTARLEAVREWATK